MCHGDDMTLVKLLSRMLDNYPLHTPLKNADDLIVMM